MAQQAAIEALRNSAVVIFCVDVSKEGWSEDTAIRKLIHPGVRAVREPLVLPVATKCDLIPDQFLPDRLAGLNKSFSNDFLPTSVKSDAGIELLLEIIDKRLTENLDVPRTGGVALTVRHRKAVTEAIDHISESIDELKGRHDEVTAMMLRAAYQAVTDIEQPYTAHIDEQILGRIFSRFCIGK